MYCIEIFQKKKKKMKLQTRKVQLYKLSIKIHFGKKIVNTKIKSIECYTLDHNELWMLLEIEIAKPIVINQVLAVCFFLKK